MGTFNTVSADLACPRCGSRAIRRIQFKYGNLRLHEYKVGDQLVWGGVDVGRPGRARVVADGIMEDCEKCGLDEADFEVWMEVDRIVSVVASSGRYDFASARETFIVVEE